MTKRFLISSLSILAIAGVAREAWSQTRAREKTSQLGTFSGRVQSYSGNQWVVVSKDGRRMSFRVDDPAKVPGSVHDRQNVRVEWKRVQDGAYVAVMVTRLDELSESAAGGTNAGLEAAMDDDGDDGDHAGGGGNDAGNQSATASELERRVVQSEEGRSDASHTAWRLVLVLVSGIAALAGGLGFRALRR